MVLQVSATATSSQASLGICRRVVVYEQDLSIRDWDNTANKCTVDLTQWAETGDTIMNMMGDVNEWHGNIFEVLCIVIVNERVVALGFKRLRGRQPRHLVGTRPELGVPEPLYHACYAGCVRNEASRRRRPCDVQEAHGYGPDNDWECTMNFELPLCYATETYDTSNTGIAGFSWYLCESLHLMTPQSSGQQGLPVDGSGKRIMLGLYPLTRAIGHDVHAQRVACMQTPGHEPSTFLGHMATTRCNTWCK